LAQGDSVPEQKPKPRQVVAIRLTADERLHIQRAAKRAKVAPAVFIREAAVRQATEAAA
jgi:uncharacterized protein (DUF1778 family)